MRELVDLNDVRRAVLKVNPNVAFCLDGLRRVDAVAFPCKIGDEFWTEWVGIRKVRCSMLTQKADGSLKGRFTVENSGGASIDIAFGKSDKELFLTKEEAEAHFAKMDGDGNG